MRLRDYRDFTSAHSPRNALLVECGQHWERRAPEVAKQAALRFLAHFGTLDGDFVGAHIDRAVEAPQQVIEITTVVTIRSNDFRFVVPVSGLQTIAEAGTLLACDGAEAIRTPHDGAVLVMPTRRPRKGETAVRIGRVRDR
jgi:hypothetical protein